VENNELICPFYACFLVFENLDFGQKVFARAFHRDSNPLLYEQKARAISLGYEGRIVTRLKFHEETTCIAEWYGSCRGESQKFVGLPGLEPSLLVSAFYLGVDA
jgi:hypothetical protein